MAFLLDTNVVSELRKRERADGAVRRWFSSVADVDLFVSVLVVGEIRRGIELLRRRDGAGARAIERWLNGLERRYEDRVLPVNVEICKLWGGLSVDRPLAPIDGLMAATAIHYGLTLVTRNGRDVERSGVSVLNPFVSGHSDTAG